MNEEEKRLFDHHLTDVQERVKFQHDFSQGAFKTLVLVNGGAIVAMLTYAGNVMKAASIAGLKFAFLCYALGLVVTIIANILAYVSQGSAMEYAWHRANVIAKRADPEAVVPGARSAEICRLGAVAAVIVGLAGFIGGSLAAMNALAG